MKIELSHDIELELLDKTYNITYRHLSSNEKKKLEKEYNKSIKLSDEVEKLSRKEMYTIQKMDAYKSMDKSDKVIKMLEKLEGIEEQKDILEKEFEALGGSDILPKIQKEEFNLSVSGADKKALMATIEESTSFDFILNEIKKNTLK